MTRKFEQYRVKPATDITDRLWNKVLDDLDGRLHAAEALQPELDAAIAEVNTLVLSRVNDILLPAIERVTAMTEYGFLTATSETEHLLEQDAYYTFIIPEGPERELFHASPNITLEREGTTADYAIARRISYDREFGELFVQVIAFWGDPGPHDDWIISSGSGSPQAHWEMVADASVSATAAATSATAASVAAAASAAALADMLSKYLGPLAADPAGPSTTGQFYFNTALNVTRVYNGATWGNLANVSIAGSRSADFGPLVAPQSVFTITGGFTAMDVFLNGVKLVAGVDYTTATPNVTLTTAAPIGAYVSARGHVANLAGDFYTKAETDALFLNGDGTGLHSHAIADITGLAAALAAHTAADAAHTAADVALTAADAALDTRLDVIEAAGARLERTRRLFIASRFL